MRLKAIEKRCSKVNFYYILFYIYYIFGWLTVKSNRKLEQRRKVKVSKSVLTEQSYDSTHFGHIDKLEAVLQYTSTYRYIFRLMTF